MAKVCQVTKKGPMSGNRISHSNMKTRVRNMPNLQWHRFWVASEGRFVRIRVTARGIKVINKRGIGPVLAEMRARGEKV